MKASSLLCIGDRIRELREDKQWTQRQLAEASQIHEVQIRRYENNQSLPRDAQLIKIANALGVDKECFFLHSFEKEKTTTQTTWVYCPICNSKTRTKIRPDTEAKNLIVFCPKCKRESVVDIKDRNTKISK